MTAGNCKETLLLLLYAQFATVKPTIYVGNTSNTIQLFPNLGVWEIVIPYKYGVKSIAGLRTIAPNETEKEFI
jgi:hypothetical protein